MKSIKNSNIIKGLIAFLLFLIFVCGVIFACNYISTPFSIPVVWGSDGCAYIEIQIEDQLEKLRVDVGNYVSTVPTSFAKRYGVALPHQQQWSLSDGTKRSMQLYEIPSIRIGSYCLKKLLVYASDEVDHPTFGGFLNNSKFILVDFPNSKIVLSNYSLELNGVWNALFFNKGFSGIYFDAETVFGKHQLLLSTICPFSSIDQLKSILSLDPSLSSYDMTENPHSGYSPFLNLGDHNWGPVRFVATQFVPHQTSLLNGILGMDFWRRHTFYIDVKSQQIRIQQRDDGIEMVPLSLHESDIPLFSMQMNGNSYLGCVDLGINIPLFSSSRLIDNLSSKYVGEMLMEYGIGGHRTYPMYQADFHFGSVSLPQIVIAQGSQEHLNMGVVKGGFEENIELILGAGILKYRDLFFDFKNNKLHLARSPTSFVEKGVLSSKALFIPYFGENKVSIWINTDMGKKLFTLDTGSTYSRIRLNETEIGDLKVGQTMDSQMLQIGSHDFGPQTFKVMEKKVASSTDGILGMDFLQEHQIYLDQCNRVVWID